MCNVILPEKYVLYFYIIIIIIIIIIIVVVVPVRDSPVPIGYEVG
jgi:hypothetical protein